MTAEKFLVCEDVPIARTGVQIYGAHEMVNEDGKVMVEAAMDGLVYIDRKPEDVFRPQTMESFEGKSITINHPQGEFVNPSNWKDLTFGVVFNVHRGIGDQINLLLADFLVTVQEAIDAILSDELREVSCGYDAEYVDLGGGHGYQTNILGNHVALVGQARCGAVCSIGDDVSVSKLFEGASTMAKSALCRLKDAFTSKKPEDLQAALDSIPAGAMRLMTADGDSATTEREIHIHTGAATRDGKYTDEELEGKFKKMDSDIEELKKGREKDHKEVMDAIAELKKTGTTGDEEEEEKKKKEEKDAEEKEEKKKEEDAKSELEEEAPAGKTGDQILKAGDSALLEESFDATKSMAEIIAPGIRMPSFDAKAKPLKTFHDICNLRRKALSLGNNDTATNGMILEARNGKELTLDGLNRMPCGAVRSLFNAVGALKSADNNRSEHRTTGTGKREPDLAHPQTLAEINAANEKFWANRK